MQLDTCRCILMLIVPIQTCWVTMFSDSHQETMHVDHQFRHTTQATQRWTLLLPQTKFLPISCSGQKSSLFSPTRSHNRSSISTFLLNAFMLLPLKCYPFGEDYSHPHLNNTEVNDAYTASFASKAPQGVEPHKIRRVRNTTALRKSWLNFKIRVVWVFFNYQQRCWHGTSWRISTLNTFQEEESPVQPSSCSCFEVLLSCLIADRFLVRQYCTHH